MLYSTQSRERAWENWGPRTTAQQHGTGDAHAESGERSESTAGSPATGKSVAGIINLFVDDPFGTGGNEMEQRVLTRLRKDFQVGAEDWNDVAFTGQRIR